MSGKDANPAFKKSLLISHDGVGKVVNESFRKPVGVCRYAHRLKEALSVISLYFSVDSLKISTDKTIHQRGHRVHRAFLGLEMKLKISDLQVYELRMREGNPPSPPNKTASLRQWDESPTPSASQPPLQGGESIVSLENRKDLTIHKKHFDSFKKILRPEFPLRLRMC